MTKLARLIGINHPLFSYNIDQLERATGGAGVDVKLAADILEKAHLAMRNLGLDPKDTTVDELYNTLRQQANSAALDDCDYVIYELDGELMSFNKTDIVENYHHELKRGEHITKHACGHLKLELVKRYAEHERTHDLNVYRLFQEVGIDSSKVHQRLQL